MQLKLVSDLDLSVPHVLLQVSVYRSTAVMDCYEVANSYGIPIIADGGIKYSGDITKAIAAGANVCMMGSDVAYHALQLYVHRFTVLYAGYLVYCFFLTAVPHAWLLYVNGKLSARHNRRWTAAVCHVMTGIAIAAVLLTVIIPWSLSTEGWGWRMRYPIA